MIEGVPAGLLGDFGVVAVVVLMGILVVTGKLIPRRTYDDKAHEAQEWRAESRIKDAQLAEKDKQLADLAEVGRTVEMIMRAIQRGDSKDSQ